MKKTIKKLQDAVKVAQLALLEAETIDLEVSQAALLSASFLDEDTGERIIDHNMAHWMSEDDFQKYLEICRSHFLARGIDHPVVDSYTYPFKENLKAAEDALLDACAKTMPLSAKSSPPSTASTQ